MKHRVMIARKGSGTGGYFWLYLLLIIPFIELPILVQNAAVGHVYNIVQVAITAVLFMVGWRRKKINRYWVVMGLFFVVLCLASLVSEKVVIHALSESVRVVGFCLLTAQAVKQGRARAFFKALWVLMLVLVAINTFSLVAYPKGLYIDEQGYWQNWILGYKNSYIQYYLLLIVAGMYLAYSRSNKLAIRNYLLIAALLVVAVLSGSATSVAGLAVVLILLPLYCFFCRHPRILRPAKIMLAYVAAFLAVTVFYVQDSFANLLEQIFHRNATFTGRTYLWQKAFEDIGERPLLGHGQQTPVYDLVGGGEAVTTHNFILDVLYKSGIVGMGLLAYLVVLATRPLKKIKNNRMIFSWIVVLVAFLMMSLVETYGFFFLMLMLTLFHYAQLLTRASPNEDKSIS